MNGYSEFKIFGIDHILAIFFLLIISIFIPILLKGKSRNDLYLITSILALVIIANEKNGIETVKKLGVATFHNYIAMALNGFTSGAIQMQLKSKTRNVKITTG